MNYLKICQKFNLSNLRQADLSDADLRDADLSGADLRDADLIGANLIGAYLSDADLRNADLSGAILIGANLIGANLIGANLKNANLSDADLNGANLSGANLDCEKISKKEQEELIRSIALIVLVNPKRLNMSQVHVCDTTHCLAGWVCTLNPDAKKLENKIGWNAAASIFLRDYPEFTKLFYSSNEEAIEYLEKFVKNV